MKLQDFWHGYCALAIFASFVLVGCGSGGDPNRPKVAPVAGTVTLGGAPVVGANVTFKAKSGSNGAIGVTDDKGRFELTTFEAGDGAVPGDYLVSIVKFDVAATKSVSQDDPNYEKSLAAPQREPKNELPPKYAKPETSGLTATVVDDDNEFSFELKK